MYISCCHTAFFCQIGSSTPACLKHLCLSRLTIQPSTAYDLSLVEIHTKPFPFLVRIPQPLQSYSEFTSFRRLHHATETFSEVCMISVNWLLKLPIAFVCFECVVFGSKPCFPDTAWVLATHTSWHQRHNWVCGCHTQTTTTEVPWGIRGSSGALCKAGMLTVHHGATDQPVFG